jgi:hypothetical protein
VGKALFKFAYEKPLVTSREDFISSASNTDLNSFAHEVFHSVNKKHVTDVGNNYAVFGAKPEEVIVGYVRVPTLEHHIEVASKTL